MKVTKSGAKAPRVFTVGDANPGDSFIYTGPRTKQARLYTVVDTDISDGADDFADGCVVFCHETNKVGVFGNSECVVTPVDASVSYAD